MKLARIMKPSSPRRIFLVAGIASLLVSYIGIWFRFMNDPVERTGSDFIAFYSAGRVAQNEGAAHVYDPLSQQDIQEAQVGFSLIPGQVLLYNHIPFLIPMLRRIASPDYVESFYRWVSLLIALYIAGILSLNRVLNDAGLDSPTTLRAGISSLLFLPLFFSLMNGQDTAFLFLGTALWLYGMISRKEILAGLGLSLTTVRPHVALVLALPMLFSYRKVFWAFLIGSGLLALLSFTILGLGGTHEFIDVLVVSTGGKWYGMKEHAMYNLIGLLLRILPGLEADMLHLIGWVVYGLAILSLCILWGIDRNLHDGKIGLTVVLALFVVPHLHFHDLALLLIPIYELIRLRSRNEGRQTQFVFALPIAISLLLLIGNASPYLQYSLPYLIMLALGVYPYYLRYKTPLIAPHRS